MGLFVLGLLLPLQSYFIAQSRLFTHLAITDTRCGAHHPVHGDGPAAGGLPAQGLPRRPARRALRSGAHRRRRRRTHVLALALPLLRPGLATVAIFSALAAWNEFLLALLYIQSDDLKTIPTGLLAFSSRHQTDYSMLFSALSIVTIPMIVIYIVFNRHIVEGITAGSVK